MALQSTNYIQLNANHRPSYRPRHFETNSFITHVYVRSGVIKLLHLKPIFLFVLLHYRVIVMDRGHISEMDSPANLIAQRGQFYRMCREAGLV